MKRARSRPPKCRPSAPGGIERPVSDRGCMLHQATGGTERGEVTQERILHFLALAPADRGRRRAALALGGQEQVIPQPRGPPLRPLVEGFQEEAGAPGVSLHACQYGPQAGEPGEEKTATWRLFRPGRSGAQGASVHQASARVASSAERDSSA